MTHSKNYVRFSETHPPSNIFFSSLFWNFFNYIPQIRSLIKWQESLSFHMKISHMKGRVQVKNSMQHCFEHLRFVCKNLQKLWEQNWWICQTFFFEHWYFDYVSIFPTPPTHHVIKHKHLANPTHPLFCLRNIWMVPYLAWYSEWPFRCSYLHI